MKSFVKNEASYINGTLIVEKGDFMATCGQQSQFSFQSQEFDGAWWENILILGLLPKMPVVFFQKLKSRISIAEPNTFCENQVYFSF